MTAACDACLRRTWLLEQLSGYLDFQRGQIDDILRLEDQPLIDCWLELAVRKGLDIAVAERYRAFGGAAARAVREATAAAGLEQVCRCEDAYPAALRRLPSPPSVIHIAGGLQRFLRLAAADPVAIVGTRRPTAYGTEVARLLGRGASVSGVTVISGMAMGVDAAAHRGALAGGGNTIAVLAGSAGQPYPRTNRQLYTQILRTGVAFSELGVGAGLRKWSLIARNRMIAALSDLTVIVQARPGSGALRTAEFARMLGTRLGAVPGSVLARQSQGPHELLRNGAVLIRDAQDVLDAICGTGQRAAPRSLGEGLAEPQRQVLNAIRDGADTVAALDRAQVGGAGLLMLLAELELSGCVRRVAGGRYSIS